MSDRSPAPFDPRLVAILLEFEAAWASGDPPDVRALAAAHPDLAPGLLRELVLRDFRCQWIAGRENPVEVHLNRFAEFRGDREIELGLVAIEVQEVRRLSGKPDEARYVERFPHLAEGIRALFRLGPALSRSWTIPPGVVSHDPRGTVAYRAAAERAGQATVPPERAADTPTGPAYCFEESYRLGPLLAEGGFKRVFRGVQASTSRPVAVKVPKGQDRTGGLLEEGRVLAQLDHQNIPPVLTLGQPDGGPALLAEKLITGRTWAEELTVQENAVTAAAEERRPALRREHLRRNLSILLDVCKALRYTHERLGVIHRDLKPLNVLLSNYGEVYLTDWGLAVQVGEQANPAVQARHRDAAPLGGTIAYMAPEVARGDSTALTAATDVFLLGATLYEVLTGAPPYGDDNRVQLLFRVLSADCPPAAERAPRRFVPPELSRIARQAMSLDAKERYADAGAFAAAVERYLRHADAEERCRRAAEKHAIERARLAGLDPSKPLPYASITPLIEVADEYRQAAAAWRTPGDTEQEDGSQDAVAGEAAARTDLLDLAERNGDFALAEAQLDRLALLPAPFNAAVDARRRRVRLLDARRRRTRTAFRFAAVAAVLLLAASSVLAYRWVEQRAQTDQAQAEKLKAEELADEQGKTAAAERQRADTEVRLKGAEKERADQQEKTAAAERQRADSETRLKALEKERADEQKRALRSLPWQNREAVASSEKFHQGGTRFLAESLNEHDVPLVRAKFLEVRQRSLVPVASSSRRVWTGSLAYSPDGKYLVSGDALGTGNIRVWDRASGELRRILPGHTMPETPKGFSVVRRLAFHPNRPEQLFSIGLDGTVRRSDIVRGETLAHSEAEADAQLLGLDVQTAPGGVRLVTTDHKGRLVFRDGGDLRPLRTVQAHDAPATCARFRPDGELIATGSADGSVRLWNATGERQGELVPEGVPPVPVNDIAFSADGERLAVGRADGRIYLWNVPQRRLLRQLVGHQAGPDGRNWIFRLAWTPSGRLFSTGTDGTLRAWDIDTGKNKVLGKHGPDLAGQQVAAPLAVDPAEKEAATAGFDASLVLWDADTGKPRAILQGGQASGFGCIAAAFCPERDLLLTAGLSRDAMVRSWDTVSLLEKRTFTEGIQVENSPAPFIPTALALDPKGDRCAAALGRGDLLFYDTETGRLLFPLVRDAHRSMQVVEGLHVAVLDLAWDRQGKQLVSAGLDRKLKVWDPRTGKATSEWEDTGGGLVSSVMFDPKGELVVTTGVDGTLCLWDPQTGTLKESFPGHPGPIWSAQFSPDGKILATASTGLIVLWDWDKRVPLRAVPLAALMDGRRFGGQPQTSALNRRESSKRVANVSHLAFSANGKLLAAAQADGSVSIVDVGTGAVLHRGVGAPPQPMPFGRHHCFFDRDGRLLTVSTDGEVCRWDLLPVTEGQEVFPETDPLRLAAAPDGGWVALASLGHEILFWDPVKGAANLPALTPDKAVRRVSFGGAENWPSAPFVPGRSWWERPMRDVPGILALTPNGKTVVVGNRFGTAAVLDRASGRVLASFRPPRPYERAPGKEPYVITCLAVSPDGELAATNSQGEDFDVWKISDGSLVKSLKGPGSGHVGSLAFRPAGPPQLAAVQDDGTLSVWDVKTGARLFQAQGPTQTARLGALAYAPDGSHIVQAGLGSEIIAWEADTGKLRRRWDAHEPVPVGELELAAVYDLQFSPDGKRLASCGSDGVARLWERDREGRYQLVAVLSPLRLASYQQLDRGALNYVVFSVDGRYLLTGGAMTSLTAYRLEEALGDLTRPAAELLRAAETLTGLRREGDGLAPLTRNHFVRVRWFRPERP